MGFWFFNERPDDRAQAIICLDGSVDEFVAGLRNLSGGAEQQLSLQSINYRGYHLTDIVFQRDESCHSVVQDGKIVIRITKSTIDQFIQLTESLSREAVGHQYLDHDNSKIELVISKGEYTSEFEHRLRECYNRSNRSKHCPGRAK